MGGREHAQPAQLSSELACTGRPPPMRMSIAKRWRCSDSVLFYSEIVLSVRRLFGSTAHFWALASGAGGAIRITLCLLSCPHALAQLLGGMQRMPDPSLAYLSVVLCAVRA